MGVNQMLDIWLFFEGLFLTSEYKFSVPGELLVLVVIRKNWKMDFVYLEVLMKVPK